MNATDILLQTGAAVALLLWGLRMVRTGLARAFGARLRRAVAVCARHRLSAFAAGLAATLALQSSTATTLIAGSFAGRSLLALPAALAVVLGADIGTALCAGLLTFRPPWLAPLLLIVGVGLAMSAGGSGARQVGRAAAGLGLMLLALQLIVAVTDPLRGAAGLATVLAGLAAAPVAAVVAAAVLTWLAHSSLAVVLLLTSLAAGGLLRPDLAVTLVVGANVGSGLIAVLLTAKAANAERRVPLGNLLMRLALALALIPCLPALTELLAAAVPDPARQVVAAHLGFNAALALAMMPLLGPLAWLLERLQPAEPAAGDLRQPRHLEPRSLDAPAAALACATREALRIGEQVEDMLRDTIAVLERDDQRLARAIAARDDVVDALHEAVKRYLAVLVRQELGPRECRRAAEILAFTTNLEHVGDIIDRGLLELAAKKIKHGLRFSPAGFEEIRAVHAMALSSLRLALNVFVTGDPALARQLVAGKAAVRAAERAAAQQHLERLASGRADTSETSSLHLDILRDLKHVNSHLAAIAYPILEPRGELASSRLRAPAARLGRESHA